MTVRTLDAKALAHGGAQHGAIHQECRTVHQRRDVQQRARLWHKDSSRLLGPIL